MQDGMNLGYYSYMDCYWYFIYWYSAVLLLVDGKPLNDIGMSRKHLNFWCNETPKSFKF